VIYQNICPNIVDKGKKIIDKNQNSIAIGIVGATTILERGDIIDICQKLIIIRGKVKRSADILKIRLSFIAKKEGIKYNNFSNGFCKYTIPSTEKKLNCRLIS
jgi:hypothetical protein